MLFTAPLALAGSAAPSLWLVVVRFAGLAALALAFRLGGARRWSDRRGDRGDRALRQRPSGCASCRRATSSRWSWRSCSARSSCTCAAAATAAFLLGALAGLARPEVWPLVGAYATYVAVSERRWWPLALGVPGMFALWIVPDWLGSGDLLHTFHLARISAEPRTLQGTGDPGARAPARRGRDRAGAGVDRRAVRPGLRLAHPRSHRGRARLRRGGMGRCPPSPRTALGYPAVPRYLVGPVAICCVLAGIGVVAVVRLASRPRNRATCWRRPCSP